MQIYNERLHDLLQEQGFRDNLEIHEVGGAHPPQRERGGGGRERKKRRRRGHGRRRRDGFWSSGCYSDEGLSSSAGGMEAMQLMPAVYWGHYFCLLLLLLQMARGKYRGEIYVSGLAEFRVKDVEDVLELVQLGNRNRAIRATECNEVRGGAAVVVAIVVMVEVVVVIVVAVVVVVVVVVAVLFMASKQEVKS